MRDYIGDEHLFSALESVVKSALLDPDEAQEALDDALYSLSEYSRLLNVDEGKDETTERVAHVYIVNAITVLSEAVSTKVLSDDYREVSDSLLVAVRSINLAKNALQETTLSSTFADVIFTIRLARMFLSVGDMSAAANSINHARSHINRLLMSVEGDVSVNLAGAEYCLEVAVSWLSKEGESEENRVYDCQRALDSTALSLSNVVGHMPTTYRYPEDVVRFLTAPS